MADEPFFDLEFSETPGGQKQLAKMAAKLGIEVEHVDIVVVDGRQLSSHRYDDFPELFGYEGHVVFTCDGCTWRSLCPLSYDDYNTNGDCLASK